MPMAKGKAARGGTTGDTGGGTGDVGTKVRRGVGSGAVGATEEGRRSERGTMIASSDSGGTEAEVGDEDGLERKRKTCSAKMTWRETMTLPEARSRQ